MAGPRLGFIGYRFAKGIATVLDSYLRCFEKDFECAILAWGEKVTWSSSGISCDYSPRLNIQLIEQWVKNRKIDKIIFIEQPAFCPTFFDFCKRRGIENFCCVMIEWFDRVKYSWDECKLIAPTKMTQRILKEWGFNSEYITYGPHPDDFMFIQRGVGKTLTYLHNGGWLGILGRKSTDEVIEAGRILNSQGVENKIFINVQKQPKALSLSTNIDMHLGHYVKTHECYEKGDIAIQPSKFGGLELTILESMACGLPVVTTNYEPMSEFIIPGKTGWLIDPEILKKNYTARYAAMISPQKLAFLMKNILTCDIAQASCDARAYIEKSHSFEEMKENLRRYVLGHSSF